MKKLLVAAMMSVWGAVSLLAQPVITQQPTNQTVVNGDNVVLTVQVSGAGPFTYQWQCNGTNLPNNIITTIAGNGARRLSGDGGDGGAATNGSLNLPNSALMDASGNLFVADENRIREVATNDIISTIAGGGTNYLGSGIFATNALLMIATGIAIDVNGNVLVADFSGGPPISRVRKINTNGIITTVAGGGTNSAIGIMATNSRITAVDIAVDNAGDLFIAGFLDDVVYKVDANGIITIFAGKLGSQRESGDGAAATNASLTVPQAVALDATGNLFIADIEYVRKVDLNGIITTVAGGGTNYPGTGEMGTNANLSDPGGVAIDARGNLFFSDRQVVWELDTNGILTLVAGNGIEGFAGDGGAATNASLYLPQRVSVDAAGNLIIADSWNNRIREVALAGCPLRTLNQVNVNNAGIYSVTITSPEGSVTSSNAVLTVIVPPSLFAAPSVAGSFSLAWSAQSNFTYQLQYTTNLSAPSWVNLGGPITATNGSASTADFPVSDFRRFYRLQLVQ